MQKMPFTAYFYKTFVFFSEKFKKSLDKAEDLWYDN